MARPALLNAGVQILAMSATIHSFIPDTSKAPLQVHYYSEALLTTTLILCRS